jgi:hypothetical protein
LQTSALPLGYRAVTSKIIGTNLSTHTILNVIARAHTTAPKLLLLILLEMENGTSESAGLLEARTGVEPVMEVLQTSALPLGYRATL